MSNTPKGIISDNRLGGQPSGLKAPFPYMGGKSRVAKEVWRRFGNTPNYVEPFFGSGAVLLGRPGDHLVTNRIETVSDIDGHLSNFWRALQADPDAVAYHADWPVSELDLHARGDWLYYRPDARAWVERLRSDPDYYDAKSAGWWVWFASCWIGGLPSIPETGEDGQTVYGQGGGPDGVYERLPHAGDAGRGVHRKLPHAGNAGTGVARQRGQLGNSPTRATRARAGIGNAPTRATRARAWRGSQRPHLGSGGQGNGVHGLNGVSRQLPATNIGGDAAYGDGGPRRQMLIAYFRQLAARLERVRVICGDWTRVTRAVGHLQARHDRRIPRPAVQPRRTG
jgi:hypothetical protein